MKISSRSTTYPQTQHWSAKPALGPKDSSWLPCLYNWPDLKAEIILMSHFLFHRTQPNTHPSPFKHQDHNSSLDPYFLCQTLSLDSLISQLFQSLPTLTCSPFWITSFLNSTNMLLLHIKMFSGSPLVKQAHILQIGFRALKIWPLQHKTCGFSHSEASSLFGRCL